MALDRAVSRGAGAGGGGGGGFAAALLFRGGERRGVGDAGRRTHLGPDLRRCPGRFDRRAGDRPDGPERDLCRDGRGGHAFGHRPGLGAVSLGRRGADLDGARAGRHPADRPRPGRPARRRHGAGGGPRPSLWAQRAARGFPVHRRRAHLDPHPVPRRRHGRRGPGVQAGRPRHRLRGAVADTASAVERLSAVQRSGRGSLQVERRGQDRRCRSRWGASAWPPRPRTPGGSTP